MSGLFDALVSFLKGCLLWLVDGILLVLKAAFFFVLDGFLVAIEAIVSALDFSTFLSSYAMDWAGLPTQMIFLINSVGIPQGISIFCAALVIRVLLNLIPAALTRV